MNRKASQPGILSRILEQKRLEVRALEAQAGYWRAAAERAPRPPSFARALRAGPNLAVIGEVKRRSPSAGELGTDLPVRAAAYVAGGAAAVSVLTDGPFFGGSLADLEAVSAAVPLPVLRKDFVLAPVQLWQARAAGAAAVLLICRVLDDPQLSEFCRLAAELGLAALVETHGQAELERALGAGASVVGVNNRDLDSLSVDLDVTVRLAGQVPPGCVLVGESGIREVADVVRLAGAGVDAVLVGEAFMKTDDPGAAVRRFAGVPRVPRP